MFKLYNQLVAGRTIHTFPGTNQATISEVGGKGLSLILGSRAGLPVPSGFILAIEFFTPWLAELKTTAAWSHFLNAKEDDLAEACTALKQKAMKYLFTTKQKRELSEALGKYDEGALFAIRSSSPEEDLEGSSFAGGYETVLGATRENMHEAVKKAFVSCLDHRVVMYKRKNGFTTDDPKIAVIVQEQIASDISGVGFSLDPVTNNYDDAVISANWGLGETVVAGTATPDTFVVDKVHLKIKNKTCGKKETSVWLAPTGGTEERADERHDLFTLSNEQIIEFAELIARVEQLYKKPIDIEWAYSNGKVYLLQARPITTYIPLPPEMVTPPGRRKRLYADITISVQGMYDPISITGASFFATLVEKVGRRFFLRDISRDIDSTIPWVSSGRLYVNLSNALRLVSKEKLTDFMMSFDPLAAKAVRNAREQDYLSATRRLKLLPFGMIVKFPGLAFRIFRAKLWPEYAHLRSQRRLWRFAKNARTLAEKESSLKALAEKLMGRLIDDVFFNTVPLFIFGRRALGEMKKIAGVEFERSFPPLELALPNNVTTVMGIELYRVAKLLPPDVGAQEILDGIKNNTLPESFMLAWKKFISEYGHRGPLEIDAAAPRYRDNPMLVINMLLAEKVGSEKETTLLSQKAM